MDEFYFFPHRFDTNLEDAIDGNLLPTPSFCKMFHPKCKDFYERFKSSSNLMVCPYGFAVQHCSCGSKSFFNIALSIEGMTQKKDIDRKLKNNERELRLSKKQYSILLEDMVTRIDVEANVKNKEDEIAAYSAEIGERQTLLEDTLHEVRNINKQLKSSYELLAEKIDSDNKFVADIVQTLYGNTNLLTIRLDFYDYMVNPQILLSAGKIDIPIFKKFEKVYKCLYNDRISKNINVILENKSYGLFSSTKIIEIAFFIILENAIKYSPENETIRVVFDEDKKMSRLVVRVENWGPYVDPDEQSRLFERGYRGRNAIRATNSKGHGIGLHLLKQICESNNIGLNISTGKQRFINQEKYAQFCVRLIFDNILL